MYLFNNLKFDVFAQQVIGDTQYPRGWFLDATKRGKLGITEVPDIPRPDTANFNSTENPDGTWSSTPRSQAEKDTEASNAATANLAKLRADTYPDTLTFLATLPGAPQSIKDAALLAATEKAKVKP